MRKSEAPSSRSGLKLEPLDEKIPGHHMQFIPVRRLLGFTSHLKAVAVNPSRASYNLVRSDAVDQRQEIVERCSPHYTSVRPVEDECRTVRSVPARPAMP
jgi:hypothetical protein